MHRRILSEVENILEKKSKLFLAKSYWNFTDSDCLSPKKYEQKSRTTKNQQYC